ncbi:MAG: hypothetical protein PHF46_05095, partial [Candidatus Gracilibacteria bacterium]|nr:hypothetical protein [Candidatus Gracilibacteria bacterium]
MAPLDLSSLGKIKKEAGDDISVETNQNEIQTNQDETQKNISVVSSDFNKSNQQVEKVDNTKKQRENTDFSTKISLNSLLGNDNLSMKKNYNNEENLQELGNISVTKIEQTKISLGLEKPKQEEKKDEQTEKIKIFSDLNKDEKIKEPISLDLQKDEQIFEQEIEQIKLSGDI